MAKAQFTNKQRTEVINIKAIWFTKFANLLRLLEKGEAKLPLIPRSKFESLDSRSQLVMLKGMLSVVFKGIKVPLDKNLLCFMHQDNSPSMVFNKDKQDLHCFGCQENGKARC